MNKDPLDKNIDTIADSIYEIEISLNTLSLLLPSGTPTSFYTLIKDLQVKAYDSGIIYNRMKSQIEDLQASFDFAKEYIEDLQLREI